MREVRQRTATPDGSLSACLVALLELDWAETPAEPVGEAPRARWQEWLAERNLRAVEPAELPGSGFWIAEVARDGRAHHVVMFGAPPDVVWDPADDGAPVGEPRRALVLAPLDPALPAGRLPAGATATGTVAGLFVAPEREAPCRAVGAADAVAGRGLRGDRYFSGAGTFGGPGATGHDLTLIAAESLEALAAAGGPALAPADARRNVLTRGIDVQALAGRRFALGEVECIGRRWCEPCAHLQRLTAPGVLRGLVHRGGLRADILRDGTIRVGDAVRPLG
jgi:hypothetical protein